MRTLTLVSLLSIASLGAAPLEVVGAQQMPVQSGPVTPTGWTWRMDAAAEPQRGGTGGVDSTKFEFSPMAPGWHITMGPGGVLSPTREKADGRFVLEGEMIFFPDGSNDAEWGLFVGGSALAGGETRWTAFVLRADGQAAVLEHVSGRTTPLMEWTANEAIVGRDSTGFARNRVSVRAEPDSVRLAVNGIVIQAWARSAVVVDGAYGFRIGKGGNVHITNLDLVRRLAPFPVR